MKKPTGIRLGDNFKISGGKVVKDEKAIEAKLDVSTRLKRRKSTRVRVRPVDAYRV
jgi:hypothetical protein